MSEMPATTAWWSEDDRRYVLSVMEQFRPKTVLEFGPGSSTLALIDGGATRIDACEDDPEWLAIYRERIANRYPGIVNLVFYTWSDPLVIPACDAKARYDLALIDGPLAIDKRIATIRYSLDRAARVLVPLEHPDWQTSPLFKSLTEMTALRNRNIYIDEIGPPSFAFAMVTP